MKRRLLSLGLAACLTLSLSAPALAYSDTSGHWAEDMIEKARNYGLMVGYEDGCFGVAYNPGPGILRHHPVPDVRLGGGRARLSFLY